MKINLKKSTLHDFLIVALIASSITVLTLAIAKYSDDNLSAELPQTENSQAAEIPAFPGAEGFGTTTKGGRGGKILFVTNLNDSGSGSFREALEYNGPRIVVFKVGGVIKISKDLRISNPFITIAGQTAPGDGIVIRGGPLRIATNNVIVRGLRFRVGDDFGGVSTGNRDGIVVSSTGVPDSVDIYNIVVDHCSVAWGVDENISTWSSRVRDVTFSYNISAQALYDSIHVDEGQPAGVYDTHSMGFLVGDQSKRISIHHNLLAHNHGRPPAVFGNASAQIVNNVIYNWGGGSWPVQINNPNKATLPSVVDVVGNYIKRGINSTTTTRIAVLMDNNLPEGSKVYVQGNKFYAVNGSALGTDLVSDNAGNILKYKSSNLSLSPALRADDSTVAYDKVLSQAGAMNPKRDSVDEYIVNSVKTGTGTLIDCVENCNESSDRRNPQSGYPNYNSGTAPTDSDKDGIPDTWEVANGLNPQSVDSNGIASSGYTWIEEYLNSFFTAPTSTPNLSPLPSTNTELVTQLSVKDSANAADWSIRAAPVSGNKAYGDRDYVFSTLPDVIKGSKWIRTPADSKLYTQSPLATFVATRPVTVYIAHDDRITSKPSWISTWTQTSDKIILPNAPTFSVSFTIYSKTFPAGTVSLGNSGHTSHLMYMIFVK